MGRSKASPTKRKAKGEKDPNKPKRPTSAYFYFIADQRLQNAKVGKKVTRVAEWTKEVSVIWRALTDEEKQPFNKSAAKDKIRYTEAMDIYKGTDSNKPKRPMSAYFLWLADFRKEMKNKFNENKELLRAAGEKWKKLTDSEKKPYEHGAEGERKKYEIAMRDYHQAGGAAAAAATKAKKQKVDDANGQDDDDDDEEEEDDDEEEDEDESDD